MRSGDPRETILGDLRTADRLVASAIATLRYARRQQRVDFLGLLDGGGEFGTNSQLDNASAANDLVEAHAAVRRVETRLGLATTTAELDLDLDHRRLWIDIASGLVNLIPLENLSQNLVSARSLQAGIRRLFASVRDADPALAARVEPLTDWDAGPSRWAMSWRYNRGPLLLVVAAVVVGIVVSLLSG